MKKRFHILVVGNNITECTAIKNIIAETRNEIFEAVFGVCIEEAIDMIKERVYSIVIIDLDFCSFDQAVLICEKVRESSKDTILVVVTDKIQDFLFDTKLIDIPIDDFFRKPYTEDVFKRRLLMWSIRYRKRVLTSMESQYKMREYQNCLDEMKKLENNLKEILGNISDG